MDAHEQRALVGPLGNLCKPARARPCWKGTLHIYTSLDNSGQASPTRLFESQSQRSQLGGGVPEKPSRSAQGPGVNARSELAGCRTGNGAGGPELVCERLGREEP